ncbi:xanthine dehydrogenase accessory factor [Desulfocicer vacuolatum DSM 3385]|uniref:Xanthine dehydrogenase accessory factor n=1 Tax=Desulfocicer vacuolatum DSM 3385 TaxID=1121400 RepID=A0A1W2EPB6_9BACT|nr:XdhC/CoxI family protein [Desulfocicer vacuolatum]SMD10968.1 xanthine dehydrogenase accessory factor [Desulfocicer vacuolatum DSM 3385]
MSKAIKALHNSLQQGKAVVMAAILSKQGSAPRSPGTRMIVHEDAHISGTIGGGWVEAQVQKLAREFFKTKKGACIREFTLDSKAYEDMDMVCGGSVSLLLEYLPATKDNITIFTKLLEMLEKNQDGFMVSQLPLDSNKDFQMQRCIISGTSQTGGFQLDELTLASLSDHAGKMRSPGVLHVGKERFFVEPAQFNGTLYIIGAGHLGTETAHLAHRTGFKVIVMDDRKEFANKVRFPMAEVHVVDRLENCFSGFSMGPGSYIVIMTRGHLYDRDTLEQALKTKATYVGMIGSKSKRKMIYDYLLTQGVSQETLDEIHSPIGLSIGAQTPEEIAVSIVAELIQVRKEHQGSKSPALKLIS